MTADPVARGVGRIVVTGLGAVTAWGWGVEALRKGLRSGRTVIGPLTRFDPTGHRTQVAAEVPLHDGTLADIPEGWRRLSLADRFAVFAGTEAVRQSRGEIPVLDSGGDVGLYFGTSTGGMLECEAFYEELLRTKGAVVRLGLLRSQEANGPGDALARVLGITGPVLTISSACASGALAIGAALDALRSGEIRMAVAGGSDSLCQLTYAGFNSLRSMDAGPCRPFRAGREGLSIGEGAAVLVLETMESARERGARPLAELAGAGAACDAYHMTAPDPLGAGAAAGMCDAIADAGLRADDVDFINTHGTGTPLNDAAEWEALKRVFGERASRIPVTATKGAVGHLLGSSGALEAVATVLCLSAGEVHPTPGPGKVDPQTPVNLVLDRPLAFPGVRAAISTSLAFGGSNAALLFARVGAFERERDPRDLGRSERTSAGEERAR